MMPVPFLGVGAINPVDNVQGTVDPQKENKLASQIFHQSVASQDQQLRKNGNRFQINGKGPQKFQQIKFWYATPKEMSDQCNHGTRRHGAFPMREGVLIMVVQALDRFLKANGNNNGCRGRNVEQFQAGVVQGVKGSE